LAVSSCGGVSTGDGAPGLDVNFSSLQSSASVEKNVSYGPGMYRNMDIYTPSHAAPDRPVLIFFHGGFWQNGDKKDYAFIGQTMAQHGILTIVANYSLYPQAVSPAFLKDGADAVAWIRENIAAYGGNPRRVFLMGHSAGAYIATMLALNPDYLAQDGLAPSSIAGVIGLAGLYDFLPLSGKPYAAVFSNDQPLENTQPTHFASAAAPPMLLITGSNDDTVDPANSTALAARIKEKGGRVKLSIYPRIGHVGLLLPFSPDSHGSTAIVDEVTAFITSQPDSNGIAKAH
jgi:acetyl esterase/lipase